MNIPERSVSGIGVDAIGGPVVDPTANVLAKVADANKRQDDLREAERRYNDLRDTHQREISNLRAGCVEELQDRDREHQRELNKAEADRINSIRQVDREEVAKTAQALNLTQSNLAKQTTELATTLQNQVSTTAAAAETRRSADMTEIGKRVSALELSSSKGEGKQLVSDPQMDKLALLVEKIATSQSSSVGEKKGINASWIVLLGGVSLLSSLIAIGAVVVSAVLFIANK